MRSMFKRLSSLFLVLFATAFFVMGAIAQETTGALEGTVKDPTGAVIPNATVTVTAPNLVGSKTLTTDSKGYYHFLNLPPSDYTITVTAQGFSPQKRTGLHLEVGHIPTVDVTLTVGPAASTEVEVTSAAPQIDVTSVTTQTNITQDVVNFVPHGTSFQSVIQFAPSASNEPLMGSTMTAGTGSGSPGSMTNGNAYGFSIAGGSDSENAYLVEGQETANIIGGYSHTNVPFDFIQEEEVKTSGITAQYGGALGGVVNVIMKKGTPQYHGSLFIQYESTGLDAESGPFPRYDPSPTAADPSPDPITGLCLGNAIYCPDQPSQYYQPIKPRTQLIFPGFTIGGPLIPTPRFRDKIFFFVGFNPEMYRYEEKINYGPASVQPTFNGVANQSGYQPFSQNTNTYYTTARIDAQVSQKIRVYASWLYQLQRQYGEALPLEDSKQGYYNPATGCYGYTGYCPPNAFNGLSNASPQFAFAHNLGYDAPNTTWNFGADVTLTSHLVSTTRFGYYFENYHDFGYPTTGNSYVFETSGTSPGVQEGQGYQTDAIDQNYTIRNASKAIQLNEAVSWYKSTGWGTHNFVFGYDLNRLSNDIDQGFNNPIVEVSANTGYEYGTDNGYTQCSTQATLQFYNASGSTCAGSAGYVTIQDYGSYGKATSYNNGLFAQDSWTIGKGLTVDAGLRIEKEFLPGEAPPSGGTPAKPIDFGWGDKVAPRLGFAWDVKQNGKYKIFGSYGKFYDIMKLNLAISSFGGQYWQNCVYGITSGTSYSTINPVRNQAIAPGRYCGGPNTDDTTQANFPGGTTPAGLTFIEDLNYRTFPTTCSTCSATEEGVAPGLKPYQQHESVFGADWQIAHTVAFEARWDRRRLDRAIEDSSIYNPAIGETFVIVNPGFGANATFTGFCDFIAGPANSAACNDTSGGTPPEQTIPAARSYDGVEFRLNKATTHHWGGMLSYTWSYFRGNYTGLTSSDLSDGDAGGRNAPNNSRAFDEPYFSYNSMGGSSSGRLPTDRPNRLKGYAYYDMKWLHHFTSDFGIFSYIYQGSPETTFVQDIGYVAAGDFPVDVFNRGKWADVTQNATTGAITVGAPYTRRTPLYAQTDFNFTQAYDFKEGKSVSFQATFTNFFNEHAVTAVNEQVDSNSSYINSDQISFLPNPTTGQSTWIVDGVPFYASATHPYNVQSVLNNGGVLGGPQTISNLYGKPLYWQLPRTIRLQVHFNF